MKRAVVVKGSEVRPGEPRWWTANPSEPAAVFEAQYWHTRDDRAPGVDHAWVMRDDPSPRFVVMHRDDCQDMGEMVYGAADSKATAEAWAAGIDSGKESAGAPFTVAFFNGLYETSPWYIVAARKPEPSPRFVVMHRDEVRDDDLVKDGCDSRDDIERYINLGCYGPGGRFENCDGFRKSQISSMFMVVDLAARKPEAATLVSTMHATPVTHAAGSKVHGEFGYEVHNARYLAGNTVGSGAKACAVIDTQDGQVGPGKVYVEPDQAVVSARGLELARQVLSGLSPLDSREQHAKAREALYLLFPPKGRDRK